MSFIPGEQSDIAAVASNFGSGITVTSLGDIDYVGTNLVAGAGIALTPSVTDTSITISSTGGGGGISAVSAGAGSGITATTVGTAVTLTSAMVAGTGISLTPGVGNNLTINNTQTLSAPTGSGIALTPSGTNTAIAANLVGGTGITITPSGLNSSKTINNAGVVSAQGLTGAVSLTSPNGSVTIGTSGQNITLQTSQGGGGLSPITSFVYTDTLNGINSAGGNSYSPNSFAVPTTGMYLINFNAVFSTNGPGPGYTTVYLDSAAGDQLTIQFQTLAQFPIQNVITETGPITTLTASLGVATSFYNWTQPAILTAGKSYTLNTNFLRRAGSSTSWGFCNVGISVVKLC